MAIQKIYKIDEQFKKSKDKLLSEYNRKIEKLKKQLEKKAAEKKKKLANLTSKVDDTSVDAVETEKIEKEVKMYKKLAEKNNSKLKVFLEENFL